MRLLWFFLSIILSFLSDLKLHAETMFSIVKNVEELKTSVLREGDYVKTLGYYSVGDGGGNEFSIVSSYEGIENDGTIIKLSDGKYAVSVLNIDDINIKHFGAKNNTNERSDIYFKKYVEWCKEERDYIVKLPAMALSLYETYVFTPNKAGNNIKIIGEHKVEHRYSLEASHDKVYDNHSGTVIYSHAPEGILFDIQNNSLYAGVVLDGLALYSNNHKTLAIRIIHGGQELMINNLAIMNFYGGGIYFNNSYDGYITNLTVKDCGKFYDGVAHPALRLYADNSESKVGDFDITNTNALHFTNFHLEHCDCFCSFEKCADIFFVNGKMESMTGEGDFEDMDPVRTSEPYMEFKNEGGTISFNSVFFKTPSTAKMIKSNKEIKLADLPYFIRFKSGNKGFVSFSNCMFLSYTGGGLPFNCESDDTYCTITNSIFRYIATGRNAIKAKNLSMIGCTLCFEDDGSLYINGQPFEQSVLEGQKGRPIIVENDCIFSDCRFLFEGSRFSGKTHTNYDTYILDVKGKDNLIENNRVITKKGKQVKGLVLESDKLIIEQ